MLLVGLTGGIGSGKSTVARMLEARGAVVLDADEFARRAIDPGTPGHESVVDAFGAGVVAPSGEIDRDGLARVVFADPDARRRLEAIVHPEVARQFAESVEPYRETDRVVVYVVPLLVESRLEAGFDVVVVVAASETARVARLAMDRGMSEADARARMSAQLSDEERERVAGFVVENDGALDDLETRVDRLWTGLLEHARS
ncbi:MAG: dephospho-CoA kinase [Actinomycetota bacterium]